MVNVYSIIVTFNGMKWYDRCFSSLLSSLTPVNIIVIDNASSDNSVQYIRQHYPQIQLIESSTNLGFAKANNIGIKHALDNNADYIFLLNQDAWVEKETITRLIDTFTKKDKIGIVSPVHLNGSYTGLDLPFANYLSPFFISDMYMNTVQEEYPIEFVNAAAWMLSSECIKKVGGFDTSLFFHYDEDRNFCQRVIFHKFNIIINPSCTICHDREYRGLSWGIGGKIWEKQNVDSNFKLKLGNINHKVSIPRERRNLYKHMFWDLLTFKFKSIPSRLRQIKLLPIIEKSRMTNIEGGQCWL